MKKLNNLKPPGPAVDSGELNTVKIEMIELLVLKKSTAQCARNEF